MAAGDLKIAEELAEELGLNGATEALAKDAEAFHLTDLGNAKRLVAKHGRDARYCYPWGKWLRRSKGNGPPSVNSRARKEAMRRWPLTTL